jgi:hypothetical protein
MPPLVQDKVLVYRFGDRNKAIDWLSRRRQKENGSFTKPKDSALNDWALKQSSYGSQSENVEENPFISVATSYETLYNDGEVWVQKILKEVPHIGVFSVPFDELYRPRPTKLISKKETEWLYYDGTNAIMTYFKEWKDNPYKT